VKDRLVAVPSPKVKISCAPLLTQSGVLVGESIYSGFTHNPHHLILDSVIDPKRKGVGESLYSGFTHNPHHLILDSVIDPKRKGVGESIYSGFTHNPHHLILDSVPK
jgi:uncharacterized membrane protein